MKYYILARFRELCHPMMGYKRLFICNLFSVAHFVGANVQSVIFMWGVFEPQRFGWKIPFLEKKWLGCMYLAAFFVSQRLPPPGWKPSPPRRLTGAFAILWGGDSASWSNVSTTIFSSCSHWIHVGYIYTPTWMFDFYGTCRKIYQSHGCYGVECSTNNGSSH